MGIVGDFSSRLPDDDGYKIYHGWRDRVESTSSNKRRRKNALKRLKNEPLSLSLSRRYTHHIVGQESEFHLCRAGTTFPLRILFVGIMNLARLHANSDSSPRSRRLFIERKTSPTRAILASIVTKKPASNVLLNRSFLKKIRSIVQSSLRSFFPVKRGQWLKRYTRGFTGRPISSERVAPLQSPFPGEKLFSPFSVSILARLISEGIGPDGKINLGTEVAPSREAVGLLPPNGKRGRGGRLRNSSLRERVTFVEQGHDDEPRRPK